jgi:hypothetical protein
MVGYIDKNWATVSDMIAGSRYCSLNYSSRKEYDYNLKKKQGVLFYYKKSDPPIVIPPPISPVKITPKPEPVIINPEPIIKKNSLLDFGY